MQFGPIAKETCNSLDALCSALSSRRLYPGQSSPFMMMCKKFRSFVNSPTISKLCHEKYTEECKQIFQGITQNFHCFTTFLLRHQSKPKEPHLKRFFSDVDTLSQNIMNYIADLLFYFFAVNRNTSVFLLINRILQSSMTFKTLKYAPFYSASLFPIKLIENEFSSSQPSCSIQSSFDSQSQTCVPLLMLRRIYADNVACKVLIICTETTRDRKARINVFRAILGDTVDFVDTNELIQMGNSPMARPLICIMTATELIKFIGHSERPIAPFCRFYVEDIYNRAIVMDVLQAVLREPESKWRQLVILGNDPELKKSDIVSSLRLVNIVQPTMFPVSKVSIPGRGTDDGFIAEQIREAIHTMKTKSGNAGPGHIICFLSGYGFCSSVFAKIQLGIYPGAQVLRTELVPTDSPQLLFDHIRSEIESFGDPDALFIFPILDSFTLQSKSYILPEDLCTRVIYVICTPAETSPWVEVGEIAFVIDCGVCQQPVYNPDTDCVQVSYCIAPSSILLNRRSHLGKTRPGTLVALIPRSGAKLSVFPEIERCDFSHAILMAESLHCQFNNLKLISHPPPERFTSTRTTLVQIGAVLESVGTTQLGDEILKYPHNLNVVHVAAMIRYSAEHENAREHQLYMGIVFYIMSCGLQLLQPGKETPDAMKCFCPYSDIVTLINIVGPVLVDRTHDNEFIDRLTINASVLDRLRSDIDELIDFLGLTHDSLTSFMQLNHLELIDSIVTFLITTFDFWCNARMFQYIKTVPQRNLWQNCASIFQTNGRHNQQATLYYRPAQLNSATPAVCFAFTSFYPRNDEQKVMLMIHRDPRSKDEMAIIAEEIRMPHKSPWFVHLLEIDIGSRFNFFFTANQVNTYINFDPDMKPLIESLPTSMDKVSQLLPFVPRSVLYRHESDPWVVEILNHGTTYESRLHLFDDGPRFCQLKQQSLNWLLEHINELRSPNATIRVTWEYGTKQPPNIAILCDEDQPKFDSWCAFFRGNHPLVRRVRRILDTGFQIPARCCHPSMLFFQPVRDIIETWASRTLNRQVRIVGDGRIEVCYHERCALHNALHSLEIPYRAIPIPNIDKAETKKAVIDFAMNHSCEMKIDHIRRVIIVPVDLSSEARLLNSNASIQPYIEQTALGCILMCKDPENPVLTEQSITVFHEDGHCVTERLCRSCQEESLMTAVGQFMDESNGRTLLRRHREKLPMIPIVDCGENERHEMWPQVPIGSLLFALMMENDKMLPLVNTWMTAIYYQALNTTPTLVQSCPLHPDKLFVIDKRKKEMIICQVLNCYLAFCWNCQTWHSTDKGCFSGIRKACPKCNAETIKAGGCNHITCPCGCDWCYECMMGFATAQLCYAHMEKVHGGLGI
jgi:hypothetical protein